MLIGNWSTLFLFSFLNIKIYVFFMFFLFIFYFSVIDVEAGCVLRFLHSLLGLTEGGQ